MSQPDSATEVIYRQIVDNAADFAFVFLSPDGHIESWNRGAEGMFEWTAAEIVGRHFSQLFLPQDVAAGVPERELITAVRDGRADDVRWHQRRDGGRVFCDGFTLAILSEGEVTGFAKIARDQTERERADQRLTLQLALATILTKGQSSAEIARSVIRTICERLGWQIGVLWEVDEVANVVRSVDYWTAPGIRRETADALCCGHAFERGAGMPGEVWARGESVWARDFSHQPEKYPRAPLARLAGVRSGFAFPITFDSRVVGAMEFFSREAMEPDPPLAVVMRVLGAQIGDYIERRRTVEALHESEERYRVVSQTAPDAIITIDAQSRILFCNPAVKKIFGYGPEEMQGQSLSMIVPERLREAHQRGLARYMATGEKRIPWSGVELRALHRDGHEFPIEVSFGEWSGGGLRIFTGFMRDVTEREHAAGELRDSLQLEQQARSELEATYAQLERRAAEEEAFRHLASALSGAIETAEVLQEIVSRASQVTRADGVYVEQIISISRRVRVVAASGTGAPVVGIEVDFPGSMTAEIIAGRKPVILADMKSFGRAMAPYLVDSCSDCEVLVTPLVADEQPLGALVLLNSRESGRTFGDADVIRVRTLGDLASLALRRVRMIEEERDAKQRAEAAVRVRDETLGIVSHDLRNPLTKISLSAELLEMADETERPDLIQTIRSASRQAQRLIQDLLDVARVEAGRFSVKKQWIKPSDLVDEACKSNAPLAAQHSLKITCSIPDELPKVCADHDRLLQVFNNLIGNAIKFSPGGSEIHVSAKTAGRHVTFEVMDEGPGIPESDLPNLFRSYWQAKKTAHMGAGLGLAIVRGIVEAHGGRVSAANARDGGAVFTFTIPA